MRKNILIAGLVIALIGIFITAYQAVHNPKPIAPEQAAIPEKHWVLVVDMDKDKRFSPEDLINGEDGILVAHSESDQRENPEVFNSLDILMGFDLNKDRRLDKKDPIFSRLGLVFFPDDPNKRKFQRLAEIGIIAIVFDRKVLITLHHSAQHKAYITAGHVEMEDGTKREVKAVSINLGGYQ